MGLGGPYEREALIGELDLHTAENMSLRRRDVNLSIILPCQFFDIMPFHANLNLMLDKLYGGLRVRA